MGIRESLLNTITSVGNSDFVRIVTSAGASSKATVQNLFKSFETGLGAKSDLTTSDYIRVVGSDDNSYKQGMQSVSDSIIKLASKTGSGDANNFTTAGMYWCNGATVANLPSTNYYYRVRVEVYSNAVNQYANANGTQNIYFRTLANNAWTSWTLLPTRAEIDALNSKIGTWAIVYSGSITAGETATLSSVGRLLCFRFANSEGSTSMSSDVIFPVVGGNHASWLPISFGSSVTYVRMSITGTTLAFLSAGNQNIYLKNVFSLLQ